MPPFDLALQHHRAGRLAEAEAVYRQILAVQPRHPGALHLLGVIAHQAGRHDFAVDLIRQSIALSPYNPAAHCNLGEACRALGRFDDAVVSYRHALTLSPDYPEAHNNLGVALREQNRLDDAIASCRRALELRPDYSEAQNNLGAALAAQGQLDEAITAFHRALELAPHYPVAHLNLGIALRDQDRLDDAIAAFRRALEVRPNYPQALNNLGAALAAQRKPDEAIAAFHRALELDPAFPEAHNNLGNVLREQDRLDDAIAAFRRALELKPGYADAHYNLGIVLRERGQFDDAVAAYRRALELSPGHQDAHNNLGNALKDLGRLDDAIASFHRALQIKPDRPEVHSNLLYTLLFHPALDEGAIAAERHRWNRQFSEPQRPWILPHANDRSPERPLRIGYVSPDFRDHVVGRNVLPLFQRHDRRNFEILCYSGTTQPDNLTEEFRSHARQWRSTVDVGDQALADLIRQDRIDILVDLSQHMAGNRLPMFARKPAPVQVSFAGYPESTGLETIEYRISDRFLEAISATEENTRDEHLCLIDTFWCYDPCGVEVDVNPLPAMQSGNVTFGCLNNFCKINDPVLSLWARVLRKAENSRLILLAGVGSHRQRTLETFAREGVETQRVEFVELRPRREYLKLYHRLDIVLDTFPYNGHTTSLDALWMGVPVVSLEKNTPVSRAGLSQLTNLGLPELAASSEEDYVRIAVELAADLPHLAGLRATLRPRMQASPLMDAPRFTQTIEAAYRSMWRRWCAF